MPRRSSSHAREPRHLAAALATTALLLLVATAEATTPATCAAQCTAAVAACRQAKRDKLSDALAIKAMTAAYGCGATTSTATATASAQSCSDLSLLLLDAFAYEKSGYNQDGVPDAKVVAFDADPLAPNGKTPCRACAGKQGVCDAFAQVCAPFCLNNRAPDDRVQVIGGLGPAIHGRVSSWPREASSKVIFNKLALTTVDDRTNQQGINAAYAVLTGRKPGTRASVHYHTSTVVSCVLEGCNRITLASNDDASSPPGGVDGSGSKSATFCAEADGTPSCYLMPSWTKLLNECVGDKPVKMIDFFAIRPTESYFYSLEPLGKEEARQGKGEVGGVEVMTAAGAGAAAKGATGTTAGR
jgi:hypothetical protein